MPRKSPEELLTGIKGRNSSAGSGLWRGIGGTGKQLLPKQSPEELLTSIRGRNSSVGEGSDWVKAVLE